MSDPFRIERRRFGPEPDAKKAALFSEAVRTSGGDVALAAKSLGVSRQVIGGFMRRHPDAWPSGVERRRGTWLDDASSSTVTGPLARPRPRYGGSPVERFESNIDRSGRPHLSLGSPCHVWLGSKSQSGYGKVTIAGKDYRAHRVAYERHRGPIPQGLGLDHLCRNRACVNPDHLEAVTARVNTLRGDTITARNAKATHCLAGHSFDEANTAVRGGRRLCRACGRERHRRWKAKQSP